MGERGVLGPRTNTEARPHGHFNDYRRPESSNPYFPHLPIWQRGKQIVNDIHRRSPDNGHEMDYFPLDQAAFGGLMGLQTLWPDSPSKI
jgi:hypothetical protein